MSARRPFAASRRRALAAMGLTLTLGVASAARAADKALPLSSSLQDELARALKTGQPLLVMVSLHRCPWCEAVRSHYLAPMRVQEGLRVVQVDMQSGARTRSPRGEATTHDALVRGWAVKIAPTLLFLGPGGAEVADRLVGGVNDFYSAQLDRRLAQARAAVAK